MSSRPVLKFVQLNRMPILQQLQLDEALLRTSTDNWCTVNVGSPAQRAIVLGIGGKVDKLVNARRCVEDGVPLVRRFSGGGTVFVNEQTCFVSLIANASHLYQSPPISDEPPAGISCYPRPLMEWSSRVYSRALTPSGMPTAHRSICDALHPAGQFRLQENDYCFGEKKFGGNAQSITRQRFCHHTSFLWDFEEASMMQYLKMPEKTPQYRSGRSHLDFLCKMKDAYAAHAHSSNSHFFAGLFHSLQQEFQIEEVSLSDALRHTELPHQSSTRILQPNVDFEL